MIRIIFIGNFLAPKHGTYSVGIKIGQLLEEQGYEIKLYSFYINKIIRLFDILITVCFRKGDIFHIDVYSGTAFIISEVATFILKLRRKNVILTLHGGMLPEFYRNNSSRIKKVFRNAKYIQTPSQYLKNFFEQNNFCINFLPNPIELGNFPFKRENIKKHSILWVRAFTPIYNPFVAVKTLNDVKKMYPDTTLTMVGPDKGLLGEIRSLIKEYNLENSITITGPIKNDELYSYYQSHEVYINTTSYESFGVALVEAASCGIPIVTSSVGEIPYIWKHGYNAMLVEDISAVKYSKSIIELFEDIELEKTLSINARLTAMSFSSEKIIPKWIELIEQFGKAK